MFVSGFTIVRNAIRYDYPFTESIRSLLPLVDEMVIAVGECVDGTRERILSIDSSKIRIIDTIWDNELTRGGLILGQQTNLALNACTGDWCFYLQADEVLHERDYPRLKRAMRINLNRPNIDGLSFRYHHFRADYFIRDPLPYRRQVRIVRGRSGVRSHGDACGFQVESRKLRSRSTGAWVYHYGYVKPPSRMAAKMEYFLRIYDGYQVTPGEKLKAEDYEWDLRTCEPFGGSHPQIMQARIAAMDWQAPSVHLTPRWRNHRFWSGLAQKNTRTFRRWAEVARNLILPQGGGQRKAS